MKKPSLLLSVASSLNDRQVKVVSEDRDAWRKLVS